MLVKAKAAFLEYGWPDSFRMEDWRNDVWANFEKWEQEDSEEYRQQEEAKKAQEGLQKLNIQGSS